MLADTKYNLFGLLKLAISNVPTERTFYMNDPFTIKIICFRFKVTGVYYL